MSAIRSGNCPVLLVVDVQVGVMAQSWDAPRVIEKIQCVVERARKENVPVIWAQHESDELPRGTALWQIVPELEPAGGEERIYKRYESSFEDTPLEEILARSGVTHIILAGAQTNFCIRATAYGSLDRGYDLTLIKDGHTTGDIELPDGGIVKATGIVSDLNDAMTSMKYPRRKNGVASAAKVNFGVPGGGR